MDWTTFFAGHLIGGGKDEMPKVEERRSAALRLAVGLAAIAAVTAALEWGAAGKLDGGDARGITASTGRHSPR